MDVRGALFEGKLKQPIDDIDDVLIVGGELTGLAQLEQLLEVEDFFRLSPQVRVLGLCAVLISWKLNFNTSPPNALIAALEEAGYVVQEQHGSVAISASDPAEALGTTPIPCTP